MKRRTSTAFIICALCLALCACSKPVAYGEPEGIAGASVLELTYVGRDAREKCYYATFLPGHMGEDGFEADAPEINLRISPENITGVFWEPGVDGASGPGSYQSGGALETFLNDLHKYNGEDARAFINYWEFDEEGRLTYLSEWAP